MAGELRLRRGTTQQHETFTGAQAEVTVDTDTNSLVVHDGVTPGGFRVLSEQSLATGDVTVSGFSGGKYEATASGNTLTISGTPVDELTGEPKFHVGRRVFCEGEARTITEVAEVEGTTVVTVDGEALSAGSVGVYLGHSARSGSVSLPFLTPLVFGAKGDGVTDDTAAVQKALQYSSSVYIPEGFTFAVSRIDGQNATLYGAGTLKKLAGTNGVMLALTGNNRVDDVTLDYDWEAAEQSLPYWANATIWQDGGSLKLVGAEFVRSFSYAVRVVGGSLSVTGSCKFTEGAPHNNLSGGDERPTHYISVVATGDMPEGQSVNVVGAEFKGPYTDPTLLHLNPNAIHLTHDNATGTRYKSVTIVGNTITACGQNAGSGNVTGAIDTYNGVENLTISGNTIRLFSYAGIKVQNSSTFAITGNVISEGFVPDEAATQQSTGILTNEKVRTSTREESNGSITGNVMTNLAYVALSNTCDGVTISGNIIDGVAWENLGIGVLNRGNNVTITGNVIQHPEGMFIDSRGDNVVIQGNSGASDVRLNDSALRFGGEHVTISANSLVSSLADGGPSGIRTNGPASAVSIYGNTVEGFASGIDLRTSDGAVDDVKIGINNTRNVGVHVYKDSTVTNVTQEYASLPTKRVEVSSVSVAPGSCSDFHSATIPGVKPRHSIAAAANKNLNGMEIQAWSGGNDSVQFMFVNPAGNPAGTVSLTDLDVYLSPTMIG